MGSSAAIRLTSLKRHVVNLAEAMMQTRLFARLAMWVCVTVLTACVTSTTVGKVWQDQTRANAPLGKTLVIVVAPRKDTSAALENEWVAQLGKRGVDAS